MTVGVSLWTDEVLVHAPGATVAGVEQAVKGAIAEFLRRSSAYVLDLPGIRLRAGRADYQIPGPSEGPILFVHQLVFRGRPLGSMAIPQWLQRATGDAGMPVGFRRYLNDPTKFTVTPTPIEDFGDLVYPYVAVGFNPECADHLPDMFRTHWYDIIRAGALYRLCSQQTKPYTDATVAITSARLFSSGIAQARDEARKQFTTSETDWCYPKWA